LPLLPAQLPPGYWDAIEQRFASGQQAALIGLPIGTAQEGYINAVIGLKPGAPAYRYEKHHLVPFGEFVPPFFQWFIRMMNIPLGNFNRGPLVQSALEWQGERLAPNICYEDLFGEEIGAQFKDAARAPTVLVNVSNIAWFGNTVAIDQHLNISRMRALEFARPMLRATNTGATVVIDAQGRVTHSLKRHTRGALVAQVQGADGLTLYARWVSRFGLTPWWLLGGSLGFAIMTISLGISAFAYALEAIFLGSFSIISFLMWRMLRELEPEARRTLLGTAIIIFVFRAAPGTGAGSTWWMIDHLGFDQSFLSRLSLVSSALTLIGLFAFRRLMAERSLAYIVGLLTLASFVLGLPTLGMFYGLHEWTAALTGGVVDARMIALIDTALESPLGQISMVPLLAWIANSAPPQLKATYFAVMASFTNLALSASQLGTHYLNEIFVITREMRDPVTHLVTTPADYQALGMLLTVVLGLGLITPFAAMALTRLAGLRSA
jgi:predicted amidohydrolase